MKRNEIPIVFATDKNYLPFLTVALKSIQEHSSLDYLYKIYIFHETLDIDSMKMVKSMSNKNYQIKFINVTHYVNKIKSKLHTRDYYTNTTYYRFFIPRILKKYDKVLYLDCDILVRSDISELFNNNITDYMLGAVTEDVMTNTDVYGTYTEKVCGIKRDRFFNAGVMLLNLKRLRKENIEKLFIELLSVYTFRVTQDEDYLNILCKDNVLYLDEAWNYCEINKHNIKNPHIVHFKMSYKPWHYDNIKFENEFWEIAKSVPFYQVLQYIKANYSQADIEKDRLCGENLQKLAQSEIDRNDNYLNLINSNKDISRVKILHKIDEFERDGKFDIDVEDDPPTKPLLPEKCDYLRKKVRHKINRMIAYKVARKYMNALVRNKKLIIKDVNGVENWKNLDTGAIITCNHFSAMDSFAMQYVYDLTNFDSKKRGLYKVIREGNYTSFTGIYGYFMRNCNTLPLSSNTKSMGMFLDATNTLLKNKNFILIYPEGSMWWNYKKPKPLKTGAYNLACRSDVPILPCFITMEDSNIIDNDGFPIQELTIHVSEPIYPDKQLSKKENIENMRNINYELWKSIYEKTYEKPLIYTTELQ